MKIVQTTDQPTRRPRRRLKIGQLAVWAALIGAAHYTFSVVIFAHFLEPQRSVSDAIFLPLLLWLLSMPANLVLQSQSGQHLGPTALFLIQIANSLFWGFVLSAIGFRIRGKDV